MSLHLSPTLGALGRMSLHLSPPCLHSGCLGPHEFTLVSHLSPTLVSHSGFLGPHEFTLVSPHLSPTLGALVRMSLHMSPTCLPTCLPHLSPTLVSHSGFLGPHEITLVYTCLPLVSHLVFLILHLSPTLVSHSWVPWAA